MEIKGNIGDTVYIKANIRSVKITEKGTMYNVLMPGMGYADIAEENIVFMDPQPKAEPKLKAEPKPKEEPKPNEETKNKRTMLTQDGRFVHSKWLRDTIDKSGLSQKAFCDKLNTWLNDRHGEGKYLDIKKYHAPDLSNYMNGNIYMSEYKINVIKEFTQEPKEMEIPERNMKIATVESTMKKLEAMRRKGEI